MAKTTFKEFANRGFKDELVAIARGDKRPFEEDWETHVVTDRDIERWDMQDNNVGLRTRYFPTFDIDCDNASFSGLVSAAIVARIWKPMLRSRTGNKARRALICHLRGGDLTFPKRTIHYRHPISGAECKVELLADGQQVVLSGPHPSGDHYETGLCQNDDLPRVTEDECLAALEAAEKKLVSLGFVDAKNQKTGADAKTASSGTNKTDGAAALDRATWEKICDLVEKLPNENVDWDDWVRVGFAIRGAAGDEPEFIDEAYDVFDAWSEKSDKYDGQVTYDKWHNDIDKNFSGTVGVGTLVHLGTKHGISVDLRPDAKTAFGDDSGSSSWDLINKLGGSGKPLSAGGAGSAGVVSQPAGNDIVVYPRDWIGKPAPVREWLVDGYIPLREVTSIYSKGGLGKSLLGQQLGTCSAIGADWLGLKTRPGRTLIVSCEDSVAELHRRQEDLNSHYSVGHGSIGKTLGFLSRVGALSNSLMEFDPKTGRGSLTPFWELVRDLVKREGSDLLVLDTVADVYPGNENDRHQVNLFVKACLGKLIQETGVTILMLAHPSKSGLSDGSLYSGSTAWEGAVRSRLYMREHDQHGDLRVFSKGKSNYSGLGEETFLEWRKGVLVVHSRTSSSGSASPVGSGASVNPFTGNYQIDDDMDALVLAGVQQATGSGHHLRTSSRSPYFLPVWLLRNVPLPAHLASYADVNNVSDAMFRLLRNGTLGERPIMVGKKTTVVIYKK